MNRIQTIQAVSRIELFRKVMDIPGTIIECGVYKGNALMLFLRKNGLCPDRMCVVPK